MERMVGIHLLDFRKYKVYPISVSARVLVSVSGHHSIQCTMEVSSVQSSQAYGVLQDDYCFVISNKVPILVWCIRLLAKGDSYCTICWASSSSPYSWCLADQIEEIRSLGTAG